MSSQLTEHVTGNDKGLSLNIEACLGKTFALGRHHASWFLLCVDLPSLPAFPSLCLNWVSPHVVVSPLALQCTRRYFVYHAAPRGLSLVNLLRLRDCEGQAVLKLTGENIGSKPILEVLLDESAVLQCCAHCGLWESLLGERFSACGSCHARYYCSKTVSVLRPSADIQMRGLTSLHLSPSPAARKLCNKN